MFDRSATAPGEHDVSIPVGPVVLDGALGLVLNPRGIVLFAHGSGSSRHSRRNRFVADELREAGLATLLFDLLTADEEAVDRFSGHLRFNIALLAERLVGATDWLAAQPATRDVPVGYFGASTGGGAALVAAVQRPDAVGAVVSRGGRPDLAEPVLDRVRAPTLLIVGGDDEPVIEMNRAALALLPGEARLDVVPGATHLFEEPGALEAVARLAADWFTLHLAAGRTTSMHRQSR
jgi:pimeloyl-ACP methyl ester carboxylesterase